MFYFFLLFLKESFTFFYFFFTFLLSIWCLIGVRTYLKYAKFKFRKKMRSTNFSLDFQAWLQCDYSVIIVKNKAKWTWSGFKKSWPLFYASLRCRWDRFFRSCNTFSTTLKSLMTIPEKCRFSPGETKISYVIVWMTLAIHSIAAKQSWNVSTFFSIWKSMRLFPRRRTGYGGCWDLT